MMRGEVRERSAPARVDHKAPRALVGATEIGGSRAAPSRVTSKASTTTKASPEDVFAVPVTSITSVWLPAPSRGLVYTTVEVAGRVGGARCEAMGAVRARPRVPRDFVGLGGVLRAEWLAVEEELHAGHADGVRGAGRHVRRARHRGAVAG